MKKLTQFWADLDKQREMFHVTTLEGFTRKEYQERYKLTAGQTDYELEKLVKAGKIQFIGLRPPNGEGARPKAYVVK